MKIQQTFNVVIDKTHYRVETKTVCGFDRFAIYRGDSLILEEFGECNPLRNLWTSDKYRNSCRQKRDFLEIDRIEKAVKRELGRLRDDRKAA